MYSNIIRCIVSHCHEMRKLLCYNEKKVGKVLVVRKIVVPLHPLSLKTWVGGMNKASSLKDLHRQRKK